MYFSTVWVTIKNKTIFTLRNKKIRLDYNVLQVSIIIADICCAFIEWHGCVNYAWEMLIQQYNSVDYAWVDGEIIHEFQSWLDYAWWYNHCRFEQLCFIDA